MEPLFFKAENKPKKWTYRQTELASMEPLFFKAENILNGKVTTSFYFLLQWSRFFSKRKIALSTCRRTRQTNASMEPLFFKAENEKKLKLFP